MKNKIVLFSFAIVVLLVMALSFLINPSYQKSIEAKYYYEIGSYKIAYALANEAFSMDVYNRMASTIMAQSKTSLKYVAYLDDAKKYMQEIDTIASEGSITDAQRAKIKIMCHIMIDSYSKLAPSVITDEALVQETKKYFNKFEKLLEQVDR
jgi:hypothetical protein